MAEQKSFTSSNPKMSGRTLSDEMQKAYPARHAREKQSTEAANTRMSEAAGKAKSGDYKGAAVSAAKAVGHTLRSTGTAASMLPGTYAAVARRAMSKNKSD